MQQNNKVLYYRPLNMHQENLIIYYSDMDNYVIITRDGGFILPMKKNNNYYFDFKVLHLKYSINKPCKLTYNEVRKLLNDRTYGMIIANHTLFPDDIYIEHTNLISAKYIEHINILSKILRNERD